MNNALHNLANVLTGYNKQIVFSPGSDLDLLSNVNEQEVINKVANVLATKIDNELSYIKNTIIPVYNFAMEELESMLKEYDPKPYISKDDIVEISELDIINSILTNNHIGNPRPVTPIKSIDMGTPGRMNPESVKTILYGNEGTYSKDDIDFVLSKINNPDGFLVDLWDNVICNLTTSNSRLSHWFNLPVSHSAQLAILFIILDNISKDNTLYPGENKENVTERLKPVLEEILNIFAIYKANVNKFRNNNTIILEVMFNKTSDGIVRITRVWQENYEAYLGEEKVPDAILGYAYGLQDTSYVNVSKSTIEENYEKYIKQANEFIAIDNYKVDLGRIDLIKTATIVIVEKLFREKITEEIKEDNPNANFELTLDLARNILAKSSNTSLLEMVNTGELMLLIIGSIFNSSPFVPIMASINYSIRERKLDFGDALLLATIEYTAAHITSQIDVGN